MDDVGSVGPDIPLLTLRGALPCGLVMAWPSFLILKKAHVPFYSTFKPLPGSKFLDIHQVRIRGMENWKDEK